MRCRILPSALLVQILLHVELFPAELTSVDPNVLPEGESVTVTFRGSDFQDGDTLWIGGEALTRVSFISSQALRGLTPPLRAGTYDAEVRRGPLRPVVVARLTSAVSSRPLVRISRVEPPLVSLAGGTPVAFIGEGFQADYRPRLDDLPLADVAFVSSTRIEGVTPALAAGFHEARLYTPGAAAPAALVTTLADAVEAAPPAALRRIEPADVCAQGGDRVAVHGSGFRPQTRVLLGRSLELLETIAAEDGSYILGRAPPLGARGEPGTLDVQAIDSRGSSSLRSGITYNGDCALVPGPQEIESSLAEGTARFAWHNPVAYSRILVHDAGGRVVATLAGDATEFEHKAVGMDSLQIELKGEMNDLKLSTPSRVTAVRSDCEYPPALGGNATTGEYEFFVHGAHAPATAAGCSEGAGGGVFEEELTDYHGEPQRAGSIGRIITSSQAAYEGTAVDYNKITTGFTLERDADKLEIEGYFQKLAPEFGLSLRGRLRHVDPADGFLDEFTFPDAFIGEPKAFHAVTYFRADRDPSDPQAKPCRDEDGNLRKIPRGDYLLDIYAVGGDRKLPYYVFGDDPRDVELLISGSPCPPYPLVRVRDLTGVPSLPNVQAITAENETESNGGILVTLQARGTWLDADGEVYSIENICDFSLQAAGGGNSVCLDPPYRDNPNFEYVWSLNETEPPISVISSSSSHTLLLPDWGCFKIDLTVRDKACAIERKFQHEVALLPPGRDLCRPGTAPFSFEFPTPNPHGVRGIVGLSPAPGNGTFHGTRPVEFRVLVVPRCYCDGDPVESCPAAQEHDLEFRLAARSGSTFHNLGATLDVENLCVNVTTGPVYFKVSLDDLGKVARSPHLHGFHFRDVAFQGRARNTDVWQNIGGFLRLVNSPDLLASAHWDGRHDAPSGSYHFSVKSDESTETAFALADTHAIDFGIADAGIPAYEGNNLSTGFTTRFQVQGEDWSAATGDGTTSGRLLENNIEAKPHRVSGAAFQEGGGSGAPLAFRWCDYTEIFNHSFSEELFEGLIYAGAIGPIPVEIWASVGLGLQFVMGSYVDVKVSPFEALSSGNFVEASYTLLSRVSISIPCEVSCDILGGIASIALRLVPQASMELDPVVAVTNRTVSSYYYLGAFLDLIMEAEACVQTVIFGEQCLPTIEIPLIECAKPFGNEVNPGSRPNPHDCDTGAGSTWPRPQCGAGAGAGGGLIETHTSAAAINPLSIISPDRETVIDVLARLDSGNLLRITVNGEALVEAPPLPGVSYYLTDPAGAFVSNDRAILAWTQPSVGYDPQPLPPDATVEEALAIRNLNVGYMDVSILHLRRNGGSWAMGAFGQIGDPSQAEAISELSDAPGAAYRVDGKPAVAGDLSAAAQQAGGEALVAWVRYESSYLKLDGVDNMYQVKRPGDVCAVPQNGSTSVCLRPVDVVRPQMEKTAIYVRRVGFTSESYEPRVKISQPGINIEPSIALTPSGRLGYCVWVHDPTHTDLIRSNRGRSIQIARYNKASNSWSSPQSALPDADDYPGILEPRIILKDDGSNDLGNGMLVFTALDRSAPVRDTGLAGGSRYAFASRLVNGAFNEPYKIHGECLARVYAWSNDASYDLPEWVDPRTRLKIRLPEWVMYFQRFGPIGDPDGSGNVMVSVLNPGTDIWSPATALLPEGNVYSNVRGVLANGTLRTTHLNSGEAIQELGAGVGGGFRRQQVFETVETRLEPDLAVVACTLSHAFAGPGERVTVCAEIENRGFAYSPVDSLRNSAAGVQIVLAGDSGDERVVEVSSLPSLPPGGKTLVKLTVEMPHDPVRLRAQLSPNPIDRDLKNNWRECWFGTPAPRDVICEIVTAGDPLEPEARITYPRLTWTNVGLYDEVLVYRDGAMLAALSGSATSFADLYASPKPHNYHVRGRVAASKSRRVAASCSVEPSRGLFRRGDADSSGVMNITDAIFTLSFLFSGGRAPECAKAADADDSGVVNITDPIYSLSFLFLGGPAPRPPAGLACGADPTPDSLGCATQAGCK